MDGGLPLAQDGVVPDVDDPLLKIDVLPHEAQNLAPAHPRMERDQQEGMGPGVIYPFHQQTGLLGCESHLLGGFTASGLQHTAHGGFRHQSIFLRSLENAAQMDQDLGLEGIALVGQRGHDGLDLHRGDIPQAISTNERQDVLVQDVLDCVETVLAQIGLFVEIVPHLGEMAEGLLTANIHA